MASYIQDGYTERGYIAAIPRLHDALHFTYRPALIEETSELLEATGKKPAREQERMTARFLLKKISDWDLCDTAGNSVPLSLDNLLRLNRRLYQRLQNILLGFEASDEADSIPDLAADAKNSPMA